ncbi:cytochrome P450 [Streptomyces sp. NPDC059629]|uniref:cytochrome P450 n=1 Tax=Streptomyces sp. NPDC059629 TaxID=3346889 RepID=UPI0036B45D23
MAWLFARTPDRVQELGGVRVTPRDRLMVCSCPVHRHPGHWERPDVFAPGRFLPGAGHGPADRACCVPFGWAPKKCVGANLAVVQLMALCHLMCTRYRLTVERPEAVTMALRFAPVPENFRGRPALR